MATEELLVTLGLNANKFNEGLKNAKDELKRATDEMKASEKSLNGLENSSEQFARKLQNLNRVLDAQQNLIKSYKTSIDKTSETLTKQVAKQKELENNIKDTRSAYENSVNTLGKNAQATKDLKEKLDKLEDAYVKNDKSISKNVNALKNYESQVKQGESAIRGLEKEISDLQNTNNKFNTNKVETELKSAEKSANSLKNSLKNTGDSLKNIGGNISSVGSTLTVGITAPLVLLGKKLIELASDLKQTELKARVVFGDMTDSVNQWASDNAKSFGLGSSSIVAYASNIGDLVQGMGMTREASIEMSKGVVDIGTKLANWGNIDSAQTMDDLTKAITGSHEAVQKYGIKLNDAVLSQYAMNMGLGDSFSKLTESDKALVRYEAIVGSSGNAIQYWNDGNRSLNFYLGEIKEKLGDIGETLGTAFLPYINDVVGQMSKWVYALDSLTANNPKLVETMVKLGGAMAVLPPIIFAIGKVVSVVGTIASAIATMNPYVLGAIGVIAILTTGIIACKDTFIKTLQPIEDIKAKFLDFKTSLEPIFAKLWGILQDMWSTVGKPMFDEIAKVVAILINFFVDNLPKIRDIFAIVVDGIAEYWENFLKPVWGFIIDKVQEVVVFFQANMPLIQETVDNVFNTIKTLYYDVLKPVFDSIGIAMGLLITILEPLWDLFAFFVSNCFKACAWEWNNVFLPVLNWIIEKVSEVVNDNKEKWERFSAIFNAVCSAVSEFWNTKLKPTYENIKGKIEEVVNYIVPKMTEFRESVTNAMNDVISPIQWVIDKFGELWNKLGGLGSAISGALSGASNIEVTPQVQPQEIATIDVKHRLFTSDTDDSRKIINMKIKSKSNTDRLLEELIKLNKKSTQPSEIVINNLHVLSQGDQQRTLNQIRFLATI